MTQSPRSLRRTKKLESLIKRALKLSPEIDPNSYGWFPRLVIAALAAYIQVKEKEDGNG